MSDDENDLTEEEVEMVNAIAEIIEILPKKMSPAGMSSVIVNLIDTYDMEDMWPIIALDATYIIREITARRMRDRTLN